VSAGGLAESSVTRQLWFSYSELTGLTTPPTHAPVGSFDSALQEAEVVYAQTQAEQTAAQTLAPVSQSVSVEESSVAPALAAVSSEAPPRVSAP
jgi:hypothetical protein